MNRERFLILIVFTATLATFTALGVPRLMEQQSAGPLPNSIPTSVPDTCALTDGYTPIFDAAGLNAMRQPRTTIGYILCADIDLTGPGGIDRWVPIPYFNGIFDGNGHRISHLTVDSSTPGSGGLFATLSDGVVRNLVIDGAKVTGSDQSALLAGGIFRSRVESTTISGDLRCAGYQNCGLVAGTLMDSTLSDVTAAGTISPAHSDSPPRIVGGLVGIAVNSKILDSRFAAAELAASAEPQILAGNFVGGLAGIATGTSISRSRFDGFVSGHSYVGGIVGQLQQDAPLPLSGVYECVSTGRVRGVQSGMYIGGLVGNMYSAYSPTGLSLRSSYSTAQVEGNTGPAGGLAGGAYSMSAVITDSYSISSLAPLSASGDAAVGFFLGQGNNFAIHGCFFHSEGGPTPQISPHCEPRRKSELYQLETYSSQGWSIGLLDDQNAQTWKIDPGAAAPILSWEIYPPTPTPTIAALPTPTFTATPTPTFSRTPSRVPTPLATPTMTRTFTPTFTSTPTRLPSPPPPTVTATAIPTNTRAAGSPTPGYGGGSEPTPAYGGGSEPTPAPTIGFEGNRPTPTPETSDLPMPGGSGEPLGPGEPWEPPLNVVLPPKNDFAVIGIETPTAKVQPAKGKKAQKKKRSRRNGWRPIQR
ncbi:MAG: hypothetical protein K1X83_04570 [Oligoflexia bacterium]|nr:hypothetical protein [Oligoflexia bacterium]